MRYNMAKIKTIEDESNEIIYPVTSSKAVYHDGQLASEILDEVCVEGADGAKIPKSFVEEWNSLCGEFGRFNEDTKMFECNGFLDIDYDEAKRMYKWDVDRRSYRSYNSYFLSYQERTNIPLNLSPFRYSPQDANTCRDMLRNLSANTTVINVGYLLVSDGFLLFDSLYKMPHLDVLGVIDIIKLTSTPYFRSIAKLRRCNIKNANVDMDFNRQGGSELLERDSILYMINNKSTDIATTWNFTEAVYNRLTQEDLDLATSKNITIVTP